MCVSFSRCGVFHAVKALGNRGLEAQHWQHARPLSTGSVYSHTSLAGFMAPNICIKPNNYPQGVDHLPLLFLTWSRHPSGLVLESLPRLPGGKSSTVCVTDSRNLSRPPHRRPGPKAFCFGNLPKVSSRHLRMGGLQLQRVFIGVSWKDCYPRWLTWLPVSDSGCLG